MSTIYSIIFTNDPQYYTRNVIQVEVRLDTTMELFFANGGVEAFSQQLAESYGIPEDNIEVISVFEGSVVVVYNLVETDELSMERL